MSEEEHGQSHAQQARQHLREGRFEEAIAAAHLAVEEEPESAEARGLLGVALCRTGAYTQGIEALRAALALNPHSRTARRNLALALEQDMQLAAAAVEYEALLAADPSDTQARAALEAVRKKLSKVTGTAPVTQVSEAAGWDPLMAEPPEARPAPPQPPPGAPWAVGAGAPPVRPAYGAHRGEEASKHQGDDPGGWSLDNVLGIVAAPVQFFREQRGYTGIVKPMLFVTVNTAIILGLMVVLALIITRGMAGSPSIEAQARLMGVGILLCGGVVAIPVTVGVYFLVAAVIHLFVMVFGGREGYAPTFRAVAHASTPSLVAIVIAALPAVANVAMPVWASIAVRVAMLVWTVALVAIGVSVLHDLAAWRAVLSTVIGYIVLIGLVLLFAIVMTGLLGGAVARSRAAQHGGMPQPEPFMPGPMIGPGGGPMMGPMGPPGAPVGPRGGPFRR